MNLKEQYKHELLSAIPVVSAMEIEIVDVSSQEIILKAPLNTNINYEGTAFGGSLNTLNILAGYLLVHHIAKSNQLNFESLVIQDSQIEYIKPVREDFLAIATIKNEAKFVDMFKRKKLARASIQSCIKTNQGGDELVRFQARFVLS